MEQLKSNKVLWSALAVLLAIILWLLFGSKDRRPPVPTFIVSQDTIIITPDKNFNADQVEITISDLQGTEFLSKLYALDSLGTGLKFPIPSSVKAKKEPLKIRQQYFKKGRKINCCGSNESLVGPGGGGTGVPLVGMDVVVNRNITPQPLSGTYNNCCGCTWGSSTVFPALPTTNPYVREATIPLYPGVGEEMYMVTINNTAGSTTSFTSKFLVSMPNATTVRLHTGYNYATCGLSLSPSNQFSIDGKVVTYTTPDVYYSFQLQDMHLTCAGNALQERRLVFYCTPAPSGTCPGYTISVQKAGGPCPAVTI